MSPDKYKRKCGKIVGSEYGTKEVDFMNQNSFNRFHDSAENIRNKFLNALPVILYFSACSMSWSFLLPPFYSR